MSISVASSVSQAFPPDSLSSLQRFVVDYVQGTDDLELLNVATREINMAISRVNSRNWKGITGSQSISLTASTADYSLNADFKAPIHCELLNSSSNPSSLLFYKESKVFMREHPSATVDGSPRFYTIYFDGRTFTLNVSPTSSFVTNYPTARLRYYKQLSTLSQAADRHGAPGKFNRFLGWDARAGIAAIRAPQLYEIARIEADKFWRELIADDLDSMTDYDS